ncbi:hypothetical protein GBF38_012795, partial [Nibea albiflora]
MADTERKSLVWNIRKSLLSLSSNELFQIAEKVGSVPGRDPSELSSGDAEGCFEYIHAFMYSKDLLDSEDSGMGELLALNDVIEGMVQSQGDATLLVGPVSVNVTSPPVELAHTATAKTSSTDTTRVATVAGANPHVASDTADNARPANSSVLPDDIQQMFSNYEDLSGAMSIPKDTAKTIVHFVQTKKTDVPQGRLRIGQRDKVIPAGSVTWVKCKVPPQLDPADALVLFEPEESCVQLQQLDIGEGLMEIQNERNPYVAVPLGNH